MSSTDPSQRRATTTRPSRFGSTLGGLTTGGPWWIIAVFVLLAVAAVLPSGWLQSRLTAGQSDYTDQSSESAQGRSRLFDVLGIDGQQGLLILVRSDQEITLAGPPDQRVEDLVQVLDQHPDVVRVDTYATTRDPDMISTDGRSTYVVVHVGHVVESRLLSDLRAKLDAAPGLKGAYDIGGPSAVNVDVSEVSNKDLSFAEGIALPILLALLLVVFRGVVAALVPLLGAVLAITLTFLLLVPFAAFLHVSVFALNLVFALGLGLSIDFSLLMLSRFREELGQGADTKTAVKHTLGTAGRTIAFSAVTVSAALASLLVFPQPYLYSMSIAGILVTLSAALIALLGVPAVLALLGRRINSLSLRRWRERTGTEESGFWYRFPGFAMRHPGLLALAITLVLLALTVPVTGTGFTGLDTSRVPSWIQVGGVDASKLSSGIKFTGVDASMVPRGVSARDVIDKLRSDFPHAGYHTSPVTIVLDAPSYRESDVLDYASRVQATDGVDMVAPPQYVGRDTWLINAFMNREPLSEGAQEPLADIRAIDSPVRRWVTGQTATYLDLNASLGDHLPTALTLVVLTTFAVLFLMTGSIVLPVKALVMNLLSLGAAFGVLVLVFQHGLLHQVLDFTTPGALESSTPLLILALVFGLSTDYEVFLLGRIKETRDAGADTRTAVTLGLGRTGRIVTAAAALLCVALAALMLSRVMLIKELGLGTTFAVLVDASLVRAVLVPSLMVMMAEWNWWAPRPLRFLHDRLSLRWHGAEAA